VDKKSITTFAAMTEKMKGHLIVLVTYIFFGFNIPVSKSLLVSVGPFGWSFARALFACSCFWILSLFLPRERLTQKSDLGLLLVCALFGMVFNQLSFVAGLTMTSPIDASIISTAVPVMVMIIAAIVLKEPITPTKVTGVLVGAAGALLLITSGANGSIGSNGLHGDLLCLLSGLSYAIYLVISKPLVQRYSSITIMKWTFLFSSVFLFPTGVSELTIIDIAAIDTQLWLKIAYALILGTFIPYLLIPMGLKRLRPTTMSMYNYVQPMVASIVAIIALQDTFTWVKLIAAMLVFSGVYIVNRSKSRAQMEAEKQKRMLDEANRNCR
jgi:drug/metabolite transporter (DMT)-like permease